MKLRIVEKTNGLGDKTYCVQRRWLGFLWLTITTPGDFYTIVCEFGSLDRAEAFMINYRLRGRALKITAKQVIETSEKEQDQ